MKTVLYLNAASGISGAERSLLAMLDALDRTRWRPVVMAPEGPLLCEVERRHIDAISAPFTPLTRPQAAGALCEVFQRLHAGWLAVSSVVAQVRPDVVHANSTTAMLYATRLPRIPSVWHVRDLVPLGTLGRWLYRHAARVAVISTAVQQAQLRYAHDGGKKILLLPPAIDTARFRPVAEISAVRAQLGLPQDRLLLGMIAQYVPWKRHHLFLDALCRMVDRPWHVVFAGADLWPDSCYISALRERTMQPPFARRVSWLPWQEHIEGLLAALDLCVLTSQHEPFGRVLIEAMACGVPVLAVDEGGVRDIIRPGETGCLMLAEPEAIAGDITCLLNDPARRASLGAAGRKQAAQFDLATQRSALTDLYASLTL